MFRGAVSLTKDASVSFRPRQEALQTEATAYFAAAESLLVTSSLREAESGPEKAKAYAVTSRDIAI